MPASKPSPSSSGLPFDVGIRVSKKGNREGETFISPSEQRRKCEQAAAKHGVKVGVLFEEIDVSGASRSRADLEAAIRRVEAGESGGIIVARIDRFARNLGVWSEGVRRVYDAGGQVISAEEPVDFGTHDGRMMGNMMANYAEWHRMVLRGHYEAGRRRTVGRGVHMSPVAPIGYKRNKGKALTVHPVYGRKISRLFARAADGEAWNSLARWLEEQKVPTAYGHKGWSSRSVKRVVRNRAYLGTAFHGEFVQEDAHPALTDLATWTRAQRVGRAPSLREDYELPLLSGLLRCAGCRYRMVIDIDSRGRRYRCRTNSASGRCPAPAMSGDNGLEQLVVERFFEVVDDIEMREAADDLQREHAERTLKHRQAQLVAHMGRVDLEPELWEARLQALRTAKDEAADAVSRMPARAMPRVRTLRQEWPALTVQDKRALLRTVFEAVFVRKASKPGRHAEPIGQRSWICLHGEGPAELPKVGAKHSERFDPVVFPG